MYCIKQKIVGLCICGQAVKKYYKMGASVTHGCRAHTYHILERPRLDSGSSHMLSVILLSPSSWFYQWTDINTTVCVSFVAHEPTVFWEISYTLISSVVPENLHFRRGM